MVASHLRILSHLIIILIVTGCNDSKEEKALREIIDLPEFRILKGDSAIVKSREIANNNRRTIILYFDPFCNHCQTETKTFTANRERLKDINILFISPADLPDIKKYSNYFDLEKSLNAIVGKDIDYSVQKFLKSGGLPVTAFYDEHNRLLKVVKGEVRDSTLHSLLNESK